MPCPPPPAGKPDKWTLLDSRTSQSFATRNALRTYTLPAPSLRRPCCALRLRITATQDPGAANSVQLSCLNLYSQPLQPWDEAATAPPPGSAQGAVALAAQRCVDGAVLEAPARRLLHLVLSNLLLHPDDVKFRRVRVSKVGVWGLMGGWPSV